MNACEVCGNINPKLCGNPRRCPRHEVIRYEQGPAFPKDDQVGECMTEEELLKGLEGAGYLPTQKEPLLAKDAIRKLRFNIGNHAILARPPIGSVSGAIFDYISRECEVIRIEGKLYHVKLDKGGPEFWVSDEMLDPVSEQSWNPECIHGRVIKEGDDWCPECKAAGQPKLYQGRRFLPTLSDLVDRLTIVQLKMIFIPEHKEAYLKEREDIEHDIDLIINEKDLRLGANEIHAVVMLMLCNRFIWENESRARAGGSEQDKLLKLTHSINGIRNASKNKLAQIDGGRKDYKIDALAADLAPEFGNWAVF